MSDVVSLQDLINKSKLYSDLVNSNSVKDSEWTVYVNDGLRSYYSILVSVTQDYNLTHYFFRTEPQTIQYLLPPDFLNIRGVDVAYTEDPSGNYESNLNVWIALGPYMFSERNAIQQIYYRTLVAPYYTKYRIQGNYIRFEPLVNSNMLVRLSYIPAYPRLSNPTQEVDVVNGYDDFIAKKAAIRALSRQDRDVSVLMTEVMALETELRSMLGDRNRDKVDRVQDSYRNQLPYGF